MVRAAAVSILVAAVGAILAYAVVVSPVQHGFNINTVGAILMIVGIVGLAVSVLFGLMGGAGSLHNRDVNQMTGAAVASILVAAVGAILAYAVVVSPVQHGFNINTVGNILMIVGIVGLALSLLFGLIRGFESQRQRTVVDDGRGNPVRREDRYYREDRYS
jgi:hypothetical protein